MRWALGMVALVVVARPVCSGDNEDDWSDMGKDFAEWDEETKQDEIFDGSIEKGFKNWEERCLNIAGKEVLDRFLEEQENLIHCFLQEFDFISIYMEMEERKAKGELDEVFKKYCREKVPPVRVCLKKFLEVSRECLHKNERQGLNTTLQMVDAAINFTCHNSGDRIALFLAEDGYDCVEEKREKILDCVNNSVPELFHYSKPKTQNNVHFIVFDDENCRKGDMMMNCVEDSLLGCKDPTPSNLVHGMLQAVRDMTPCGRAAQGWHSAAGHKLSMGGAWLVLIVMGRGWL